MTDEPRTPPPGEATPANPSSPKEARKFKFFGRFRNNFLTGIIVTAPIGITIWLSWQFISFVDDTVTPLIPAQYNPETYLPFSLPGLGVVVAALALTAVGALATGLMGRAVVRTGERLLARMPVVRGIYGALKQIFETVLAEKSEAFRQVVLVEFPRKGCWALGFATGTTEGEVKSAIDDEVVNIYMPTTPNPTSGYLVFVPRSEVIFLKMTVEDGFKMLISTGVITPPEPSPEDTKEAPKIPGLPEQPVVAMGGGKQG